jgi:hypothetical protein
MYTADTTPRCKDATGNTTGKGRMTRWLASRRRAVSSQSPEMEGQDSKVREATRCHRRILKSVTMEDLPNTLGGSIGSTSREKAPLIVRLRASGDDPFDLEAYVSGVSGSSF